MPKHTGQCLCGAIKFEITGEMAAPHACHCSQCVRQTGHFNASTQVKRSEFKFLEDRGLKWYKSSDFAQRGFCSECGTAIFWDDGGDMVNFSVGSLDQPTGLKIVSHIFVDEKPDYYDLEDDLPKYASYDQPID